ncbi:MAG: ATPase, T2SS/T4P/T4SS family [Polyangiaceae bacterium]
MNLLVSIESRAGGGKRTLQIQATDPITVGRDAGCGLRIKSDQVSRRHALIEFAPHGVRVEDQSTNGTLAGEQLLRKTSAWVSFGTPIVVGDHTLVFELPGQAAQPKPAGPPGPSASHYPQAGGGHPPPQQGQHAPQQGHHPPQQGGGFPRHPSHPPQNRAPHPQDSAPRHGEPAPGNQYGRAPAQAAPGHAAPAHAPPQGSAPHHPIPHPSAPAHDVPPRGPEGLPPAKPTAASRETNEMRRDIHRQLLEHLDLATMGAKELDDPSMRPKVISALRRIVDMMGPRVPASVAKDRLVGELADEALGLGPLEHLLADPTVTEIMVVDADTIYIERNGKIVLSDQKFTDDERVRAVIERIVTPLGRRIDESSPLVDARLKDGSRVNAVIRPIALKGSCITIRKFSKVPLTLDKLIKYGALSEPMGRFLTRCVAAKKNIIISGGTGSGKTTLLNILSGAIPADERIVTIEDAAELQLVQPHVVSMETRPPNMEGKGEYTIRDLLRNAMRMRPDRVVVGECRGGEALDMLQAMNTGHDGSLTTTHANSPLEGLKRIETLCLMAGVDLPPRAIREQIVGSIDVVVQQSRFSDGARKVTSVAEVVGLGDDLTFELMPIFEFVRSGTGTKGEVLGRHQATGYLPSFLNEFIVKGLVPREGPYL